MQAQADSIRFSGTGQAYMWALEALQRCGPKSPTLRAIESMRETPRRGTMTREDVQLTALTIVVATRRVEPPRSRLAFRRVFSPPEPEMDAVLARELVLSCSKTADADRLQRIAYMTLARMRLLEQGGEVMPRNWYALGLGIRPQSLSHWQGVIDEMWDQLDLWLGIGKRAARTQLEYAGLMAAS